VKKRYLSILSIVLVSALAGAILGFFVVRIQEKLFVSYRSNSYLMTTIPTGDFFRVFRGLSSPDDSERIISYYIAGQMKILDSGFIVKRIEAEKSIAVKRVLAHILKEISFREYSSLLDKHPELKPLQGVIRRNPNDLL
jgi:hypothetical protein